MRTIIEIANNILNESKDKIKFEDFLKQVPVTEISTNTKNGFTFQVRDGKIEKRSKYDEPLPAELRGDYALAYKEANQYMKGLKVFIADLNREGVSAIDQMAAGATGNKKITLMDYAVAVYKSIRNHRERSKIFLTLANGGKLGITGYVDGSFSVSAR